MNLRCKRDMLIRITCPVQRSCRVKMHSSILVSFQRLPIGYADKAESIHIHAYIYTYMYIVRLPIRLLVAHSEGGRTTTILWQLASGHIVTTEDEDACGQIVSVVELCVTNT